MLYIKKKYEKVYDKKFIKIFNLSKYYSIRKSVTQFMHNLQNYILIYIIYNNYRYKYIKANKKNDRYH